MKIIQTLILVCLSATIIFAQNAREKLTPAVKIVVVDTSLFNDEKLGIKKLVDYEKILLSEFYESGQMTNLLSRKIEILEKEIYYLQIGNKPTQIKKDELEKTKLERDRIKNEIDIVYKKRQSELLSPIYEKISEKIKEFSKENGYQIVIDKSELTKAAVIIEGDVKNVTSEFIKFCNDDFGKEKLK